MAMFAIYEYRNRDVTISVIEDSDEPELTAFTFSFSGGEYPSIYTPDIVEEKAIELFNLSVDAYIAAEEKKKRDEVIKSILSNFDIKPV